MICANRCVTLPSSALKTYTTSASRRPFKLHRSKDSEKCYLPTGVGFAVTGKRNMGGGCEPYRAFDLSHALGAVINPSLSLS